MEGVTILSATTVTLGLSWGAAILAALAVFIFTLVLFLTLLAVDELIEFFYIAIIIAVTTVVILIPMWISIDTTEVTEYKVTIDDSVSYVEFTEKYEIIDQEGEIYTVRERTE